MIFNPYSKYLNKRYLIVSHTLLLPPDSQWEVSASALQTSDEDENMVLLCNDNIQENPFWHWITNLAEMRKLALLTARLFLHSSLLWPRALP